MGRKRREYDAKQLDGEVNPLVNETFVVAVRVVKDGSFTVNRGIKALKEFEMDADACAKMFIATLNRQAVAGMNTRAKELLLWLLFELDSGRDWLWINQDRYMEENNITSVTTFRGAVAELVNNRYIFPHAKYKDVYWINPRMMFRGSRVNKYPSSVRVKE